MGVYVKDILFELHRRGITYQGKRFGESTVYYILKNEKYAGIYHIHGQTYDNMFPQIVPTETFEKVREKVKLNQYGKRSVKVIGRRKDRHTIFYQKGVRIHAEIFSKNIYL